MSDQERSMPKQANLTRFIPSLIYMAVLVTSVLASAFAIGAVVPEAGLPPRWDATTMFLTGVVAGGLSIELADAAEKVTRYFLLP